MSDLVKRLRGWRIDGTPVNETMREAADEIERLRQAILDEREACARVCDEKSEDWSNQESGFRADPEIMARSDGAAECAAAIRARGGSDEQG